MRCPLLAVLLAASRHPFGLFALFSAQGLLLGSILTLSPAQLRINAGLGVVLWLHLVALSNVKTESRVLAVSFHS